ncbi:MAG: hypothetical protein IJC04_06570 [Oscillospiraceae bacterium]|nr:hypothetical protein [Oscillospiraceae bacterium]
MDITLDTGKFSLTLNPEIYFSDIEYPENTILHIQLYSNGFSAKTTMDIDFKEFKIFISEINNLYNTLKGSTTITEPYGSQKITFSANKTGHIDVSGSLSSITDGYSHSLEFENSFDQTYLKDFIAELNKLIN